LAVRLKLRVSVGSRSVEAAALLNSGYEAPSPHLLIPIGMARQLGLWPPEGALEAEFDTAGGVLKAWLYPRTGKVKIITDGEESREVDADIVVSPLADEPLISDALAEELEIAVESFGRGAVEVQMGAKGENQEERKEGSVRSLRGSVRRPERTRNDFS
jgi:hypothetical protein